MSRVALALVLIPSVAGALVACHGDDVGDRPSGSPTVSVYRPDTAENDGSEVQAGGNTLSNATSVCGDGVVDGDEACDDGNAIETDTCLSTCEAARCGDGFVESGVEECDAGSFEGEGDTPDLPGDPCTATCEVPRVWTTVAPIAVITGPGTCTTSNAVRGRKVAVSPDGDVYVAALCDTTAYLVSSADRGATFGAPIAIGVADAAEVVVGTDPGGVVHVAVIDAAGGVFYVRSPDGGTSWTAPVEVGTGAQQAAVSIAAGPDDVWIGYPGSATTMTVLHGVQRGAGAFSGASVAHTPTEFDVMYDADGDRVLMASDTAAMHLFISDDGGATFGADQAPAGDAHDSDWATGGGLVYVTSSGLTDTLQAIDLEAPGAATMVSALSPALPGQRVVAADALGNAVVASNVGGAIVLDRVLRGESAMEPAVTVSPTGADPSVTALPDGTGAVVVYTDGGVIFAGVQVYPTSVSTETGPAHTP
jgi:cysteine-rich repeat protein